jgi:thioredoxin-like negative regulator of GroEL
MDKLSNRKEFDYFINSQDLVLIMLGSNGCGHCHDWEQALGHIKKDTDISFFKVITDEVGGLARELNAEYMPYTGLFKDSKVLYSFYGRKTKQELLDKINELR